MMVNVSAADAIEAVYTRESRRAEHSGTIKPSILGWLLTIRVAAVFNVGPR